MLVTMKDFFIVDAAKFDNEAVTSYFVLSSMQVREKKQGGQFLTLTLSDKTGFLTGTMWDDFADAAATCAEGCYVKAQGRIGRYQGKMQITLQKLRPAAESEIDPADWLDLWIRRHGLEPVSSKPMPTPAGTFGDVVCRWATPQGEFAGRFVAMRFGDRVFLLSMRTPRPYYAAMANGFFAAMSSFVPLELDVPGTTPEPHATPTLP